MLRKPNIKQYMLFLILESISKMLIIVIVEHEYKRKIVGEEQWERSMKKERILRSEEDRSTLYIQREHNETHQTVWKRG
jgi:predicted alpha/beta superfamily hydrolase